MTKTRLHYYTRQPRFILRTVLLVLGMGLLASWVEDKLHGKENMARTFEFQGEEEDKKPDDGGSDADDKMDEEDLMDEIRGARNQGQSEEMMRDVLEQIPDRFKEKWLKHLEQVNENEPSVTERLTSLIAASALPQDRKELFHDYVFAKLLEGTPRAEAQERLRQKSLATPMVARANEMMGDLLRYQHEPLQALDAYLKEGTREEGESARKLALQLCIHLKLADRLAELRSQPSYESLLRELGPHYQSEAAILGGNYGELLTTTAVSAWESAQTHPVELILTLLCGVVWFLVLHQLGGVKLKRNWRSLLAVALGIFSPILTLFIYSLQTHYNGLEENGTFWNDLLFYIAGVGLREEVSKLILFAPLLFLLRNKSEAEILVTAGCVGLGFAIEENINYFGGQIGAMPLARFVSANFLHIATTAIAGLALSRWVRFPRSCWEQGVIAILSVILVHGLYDFCIASPVPRVELSFQQFPFMILLALAQFFLTDLRRVREARGNIVAPLFAFLVGIAVLSSFALLAATMQYGFGLAVESLIGSGLGAALLIVMFCFHLKDL